MTNQEFKVAFTTIVCRIFCCRVVSQVRQRDHEVDFTRLVLAVLCNISRIYFFQLSKQ